jgi:hypothetical protein
MADEKNQSKSMADKAVDAAQKKSGNQNSKANKAVDKAQEKASCVRLRIKSRASSARGPSSSSFSSKPPRAGVQPRG